MNKLFRILGIGAMAIVAYTCLTGCPTKEEEATRKAYENELAATNQKILALPPIEYCRGIVIKETGIKNLQESIELAKSIGNNRPPIDVNGHQTSLFYNKINIEDKGEEESPTPKYILSVMGEDNKQYLFYVKPGKKPLELLAEAIEERDTIEFATVLHKRQCKSETTYPYHDRWYDTATPLFTTDGLGEVSSDLITIVKKAEKKKE